MAGIKFFPGSVLFLVLILISFPVLADHGPDVITVNPTTDGGKYITVQQSETLPQWGFNAGAISDYAYRPFEKLNQDGSRLVGIVDDLLVTNIQGAIGWTDWWSMGVNMPLAIWETWYDPDVAPAAVTKQTFYGKLGDLRLEMKFRLLDIERYHVGLALVPFMYFPTGRWQSYLGNDMWSPGGTLVFDADIANRVFLALNVGYRYYAETSYEATNANAVINDTLNLAGGINVRITDTWGLMGEIWSESVLKALFKNQLQNPSEFLAGVKCTPRGKVKGLGITLAGGRAITSGVGSPDLRVLLGVNYRYDREPPPPPPVKVEVAGEELIITRKINYQFNSSMIMPVSYPILDDVAELMLMNPQIGLVMVEGHTDWTGPKTYNQGLSERRARAVRRYLIRKGVAPDRLQAAGYGESRPIADNETTFGRARNRRTEFVVVE